LASTPVVPGGEAVAAAAERYTASQAAPSPRRTDCPTLRSFTVFCEHGLRPPLSARSRGARLHRAVAGPRRGDRGPTLSAAHGRQATLGDHAPL